ncbi:MAG TPA: DHA2 family efflux MFS transporter permease subunit [Candidatus Limnocylindrales bacterium]|nr:DHA2 family efflux MFS transporter permease subunit [Candidatus Limnocylindrales bacterium]
MKDVSVVEFGLRRVVIVAAVMLAALLQTLDATIVNVALPTIEGNLGASIDEGTWIITGYIISNVVAIPLAPYLLQRFGRRRYFAASVIGFTAASLLCATATGLWTLVLYRVVQGAFGGGLIATSQIILRSTFPDEKVGFSSALFAIALTFGPALGPTLGGMLTDAFSWQWVFIINAVPGTLAAVVILTMLRNPQRPRPLPFDATGVALLAVSLGAFQYALDEGERRDWFADSGIVAAAVAFVAGITAFIAWELRGSRHPIVDLRIFRYGTVRIGTATAVLLGMVVFGPTVMLPQYVQNILGFTATLSGLLILMRALPVLVMTPLVGRLATRLDVRLLLVAGFVLSAVSFFALALRMTTASDFGVFVVWLVLGGLGQSMLLVPLLVGLLRSVAPQDAPKVSSFISLSVQIGGSVASTLLVTVLDRRAFFHSDTYREAITLGSPQVRHLLSLPHGLEHAAAIVQQQAMNAGFADSIYALVPVALAGIALSMFLREFPAPT